MSKPSPEAENQKKTSVSRRSFLNAGLVSAAVPLSVLKAQARPAGASSQEGLRLSQPSTREEILPGVPKLADLASDRLVHHFRDLFNPPLAQNELGILQAVKSVSAITSISFPPYGCCGVPKMPFSPGSLITCETFLNGRILNAYPEGATVAYTWYPHRIVREAQAKGLHFRTATFLPWNERAVAESIEVTNRSGERRKITLGFDMRAGVTVTSNEPWFVYAPAEADNKLETSEQRGCIVFEAQHSRAVSVQGISPRAQRVEGRRMLIHELTLDPGASQTFHYLNVIGGDKEAALASYDRLQASFAHMMEESEQEYSSLVSAAFTPGNSRFSGHLPQLVTRNEALWKLYYVGFTNLLVMRRTSPDSVYGPTYLTIPPVLPTLTFIWDTMLTSLSLALLDPQVLRSMIEAWLAQDMHKHLATDYLTGKGVGPWYAVNDMGLLRCSHDYLRVTGDYKWLDKNLQRKTILQHLVDHALYWKTLDKNGDGLADYGELDDLLEVVSTWLHEVAAMNAGNVYGMRMVATLLEKRGETSRAAQLRREAKQLAERINRMLYVQGKGWWKARQPDGSYNEVRHCYDLLTVLDTMFEDLSAAQKREMSHFFWTELYSPLWMHALSPDDPDATWNLRADHSWLGAYTAWPSMTAKGLYKIDASSRVAQWVKGLAKSANQGPFGQGQIVETVFPPEKGGAMKSPLDQPYGNNWACVSGGSFTDLVIDSVFGANLTLYDGVQIQSRLADFDPKAKLVNLRHQGKTYTISSSTKTLQTS